MTYIEGYKVLSISPDGLASKLRLIEGSVITDLKCKDCKKNPDRPHWPKTLDINHFRKNTFSISAVTEFSAAVKARNQSNNDSFAYLQATYYLEREINERSIQGHFFAIGYTKAIQFLTVSQRAATQAAQALFKKRLGLELVKEGPLKFAVSNISPESRAYKAGLRKGNLIKSLDHGDGGAIQSSITGLAGVLKRAGCHITIDARIKLKDNRTKPQSFFVYLGPKHDNSLLEKLDPAQLDHLESNGHISTRLRLFYTGDFKQLECLFKNDIGTLLNNPLGGLMQTFNRGLRQSAESSRYAGLIAQYIILRSKKLGLCDEAERRFVATTETYTVYKNLLGVSRGQGPSTFTQEYFSVPERFAEIVKVGTNSSRAHGRIASGVYPFLNPSSCDDPARKHLEENMLAFYEKRKPVAYQEVKKKAEKKKARNTRFVHGYKFDDCKGADWCPKMIVVRGGKFVMGSSPQEKNREDDEGPRRTVNIGTFAVGQFEVSVGQYQLCIDAGRCELPVWRIEGHHYHMKTGTEEEYKKALPSLTAKDSPIVGMSWNNAKSYVQWLSHKTGKTYRLLSEAEWEYAALGGAKTPYWWGNSAAKEHAHYNAKQLAPVNSYKPNGFGLYQISGNASELVEDCYHYDYRNAPTDGSAWLVSGNNGNCMRRVVRGGSWRGGWYSMRVRSRSSIVKEVWSSSVGFRVAREIEPEPRSFWDSLFN